MVSRNSARELVISTGAKRNGEIFVIRNHSIVNVQQGFLDFARNDGWVLLLFLKNLLSKHENREDYENNYQDS